MQSINLSQKLSLFSDQWSPKVIAELNDQYIKLAKVEGEFVWHDHANEDELFVILKGTLILEGRDGIAEVGPGEICVVPKGVEHLPRTKDGEVHLMLIEPKSTKHTGEVKTERTVEAVNWI